MMILNDKIRQEIVELLSKNIQDVKYFHNGRKAFTDLEQELPAIAVFIDEVYQDDYTVCEDENDAFVKIGIYLPLGATEGQLDVIAEQITSVMRDATFKNLDECEIKRYTYDYDPTESDWITSTLHYQVKFYSYKGD